MTRIHNNLESNFPSICCTVTTAYYNLDRESDQLSQLVANASDYSEERLPERIVHATGHGARGYFEATNDVSDLSRACVFRQGVKVPVFARFSPASAFRNVPDTVQDNRGMVLRFYTECGNLDLFGSTLEAFTFRLPKESQKIIQAEHANSAERAWEIRSRNPDSAFNSLMKFSYLGSPYSSRHMDMSSVNTYKLVNSNLTAVYVIFHFISEQGAKYNNRTFASELSKRNPKHAREDLYNAISRGDYPSWKLMIQTMTFDQAQTVPFDPVDPTYIWPRSEFPLQPVGRFVLEKNPENYTSELEMSAYNVGNLIEGIEFSTDKILNARRALYNRAAFRRLGPNYRDHESNRPKAYARPSNPLAFSTEDVSRDDLKWSYNFAQAATWFYSRPMEERQQIVDSIGEGLREVSQQTRNRMIENYYRVDRDLGDAIREASG